MAGLVVKARAANQATGVLGALTPRQGDATPEAGLEEQTSSYATFAEPSQTSQMSAIFISHLAKGILISGQGDVRTRESLAALVIQVRCRLNLACAGARPPPNVAFSPPHHLHRCACEPAKRVQSSQSSSTRSTSCVSLRRSSPQPPDGGLKPISNPSATSCVPANEPACLCVLRAAAGVWSPGVVADEAKILEVRSKRRGLLVGMANRARASIPTVATHIDTPPLSVHLALDGSKPKSLIDVYSTPIHICTDATYLTLLLVILLCQEGNNVTNRYSVTQTLQDYVLNVESRGSHTHAHMHTCTHAHMHTCTHAHMHTCTHVHLHLHMRMHLYVISMESRDSPNAQPPSLLCTAS